MSQNSVRCCGEGKKIIFYLFIRQTTEGRGKRKALELGVNAVRNFSGVIL